MGMLRKSVSLLTVGLVDYRSDKERVARSARLTKEAVRKGNRQQNRLGKREIRLLQEQNALLAVPIVPRHVAPAGWYPDPGGSGRHRWWSGEAWTGHVS